MKPVTDLDHAACADDGGVTFTSLAASRTLTLPSLFKMVGRPPIFPVANESGVSFAITVRPAGSDLPNGSKTNTATVDNGSVVLFVAGFFGWMLR